jgi:tetratricopeptide (TPR) repeat protein
MHGSRAIPTVTLPTLLTAVLALLPIHESAAQTRRIRPEHDIHTYEVVLQLPGMDRVTVRRDLPYKSVSGWSLMMDIYSSAPTGGKAAPRPALIFINGVGDPPDGDLRSWGQYRSWARLAAVSGWVAVNFQARPGEANAEDVRDLLRHLANQGREYGIDSGSLALWACSANVQAALPFLAEDAPVRLKAAVLYYGAGEVSQFKTDLPVLLVRAGKDRPPMNERLERMFQSAMAADARWALINVPLAHHAFDSLDDTEESRETIRQTLEFLSHQFAPITTESTAGKAGSAKSSLGAARTAAAHLFGGEWGMAEAAYGTWLAAHLDDSDAWVLRASAEIEMQKFDAAKAGLETALKLDAEVPQAYLLLGRLEVDQKQFAKAEPLLQKATQQTPENPEARFQLGKAYFFSQRPEEAAASLEEAIRISPWNGYAWNFLGMASMALKRYARAVESFQRVLVYVPNDPNVNYNLACAQALIGETERAFSSLERAIAGGYKDRQNLTTDPDLASLRGDARFHVILKRLE